MLFAFLTACLVAQSGEAAEPPAATAAPTAVLVPPRLFDSLIADYEVGALYLFQNEGRYGPDGTRYGAKDVGQQRNLAIAQRLAVEAKMGRHTVIALWAPLDLTTRATLARDLVFQSTTLREGAVFDHRYLFDGYRMSYLFGLVSTPRFSAAIGASIQVRNASVEFRSIDATPAVFKVERDIGLVGALKVRLRYDAGLLYAMADVDFFNTFGLGLPAGIHDVALTLGVPITAGADFFLRLRLVGGGAEVPSRDLANWGNFGGAFTGLRLDLSLLLKALTG